MIHLKLMIFTHLKIIFSFFYFYFFTYFVCTNSSLLSTAFLLSGKQMLLSGWSVLASYFDRFYHCKTWAPGRVGFGSHGSQAPAECLVAVEHMISSSTACGIFPDQGSSLCSLHWQVVS